MNDTRKDKRAPVSLKVRFKSATVDEFVEHYARDISHGGLFIKSKQPMTIGTLLKFELQLKDESKLIQGVGRVVWKREATETATDENPAGMGIKFIKMDPESRVLVDKIVDQRGNEPGQFEAGGGDAAKDDDVVASPAPQPRPVRSAKATMQFFPSAGPTEAEMPPPEDRTQVRQASEFLAAALAEGGGGDLASQEAETNAAEARKRTEEIEKEREAAAQREKAEAEAKQRAEKEARERAEREKTEREEREKAEAEAKKREAEEKIAADKAKAAKDKSDKEKAEKDKAEAKKRAEASAKEAKATADAKPADKAKAVTAAPAAVPAEPQSNMLPIFLILAAVVAIGGYFAFSGGGSTPPETTTPTDTHATPPEGTEGTPPEGTEGTPPEGTEGTPPEGTEGTPPEGTEGTPPEGTEAIDAQPPAPPVSFRVETTPAGAEILVGGESRGTSPASVEAAAGEVTIVARLEGHREATSTITLADGQAPVRMTLEALPYQLEVVTTPPGATVRAGGRSTTTPGRLVLPRPTREVRVQASLSGYTSASTNVAPTAFTATPDAMVARVELTLVAAPAPTGGGGRRPRPEGEGGAAPSGGSEAPPAGGSEAPAGGSETPPAETPPAQEAPPENPF